MSKSLLFLLPVLSACAVPQTPVPPLPAVAEAGGACHNESLGAFLGRPASSALGSEMLSASGARTLRWVAKGMMVTLEFSAQRLTVHLDGANRVESLSCG